MGGGLPEHFSMRRGRRRIGQVWDGSRASAAFERSASGAGQAAGIRGKPGCRRSIRTERLSRHLPEQRRDSMRSQIRLIGAIACSAVALGMLTRPAQAVVQVTGNVWIFNTTTMILEADDPFTTTVNEGIPTNGNRIDPFRPVDAQIEFEGKPVLNGPGTGDDANENFDVIVGLTSSGELIINQSQLRDQDLIIGDQAMIGSTIKRGSGVVRIEGFGSLYNNDPSIIPYLGPTPDQIGRAHV